jgi:hypothetical protein
VEIWIRPAKVKDSNTLLAFYDPVSYRGLSIVQADSDLEVRVESSSAWRRFKSDRINVSDTFSDGKSGFWAVASGKSGTTVYRDGIPVRQSSIAPAAREISGRLIIGTSPIFNAAWSGTLRGLAIYDAALSEAQIARHYATWTKQSAPVVLPDDDCIALYLFREHSGSVVHNSITHDLDLYIPAKYLVVRQTLLDPVWRAFNWHRGFWKDAFINVAGFIPFGCFLCSYLQARGASRPILLASVAGFLVSAVIEVAQTQLPTRDSSMSDLINNTLGAALGALAYRGAVARVLDQSVGIALGLFGKPGGFRPA